MSPLSPPPDPALLSLSTLHSIEAQVRQHLDPSYDREAIAMDLLLESWTEGVPFPSRNVIHFRCIDYARRRYKELDMNRDRTEHFDATPGDDPFPAQVINRLVPQVLSPDERRIVFFRFYADLSLAECGRRLGWTLQRVRETLEGALYKMRQEIKL